MSVDMEVALLVLHAAVGEPIDAAQLGGSGLADLLGGTEPTDALTAAADERGKGRPIDEFAAAQAFVLGTRFQRENGGVDDGLRALGEAIVAPFDLEDPGMAAARLAATLVDLRPGDTLSPNVLDQLTTALDPALQISSGAVPGQVTFSGPAAPLATLLLELATGSLQCRAEVVTIEVRGERQEVTLVDIDVCTNQSFEHCKRAIDPLHWPDCNPYFLSVDVVGQVTSDLTGWAGVVRERVGPGINGSVYVTDLAVRYVEKPGLAAVAFDLAADRDDDGRVTVDHGFVSATDEGLHRRIRTLKVYRIKDLRVPQLWVCPLWAKQVVMAGWWCP